MKKWILVILVCCVACSTPAVVIKRNITIEKLGIYLEAGEYAPPLIADAFTRELDHFIHTYNSETGHKFKLFRASKHDSTTLRIKLVATNLVTPGQQVTGVVVSVLGISLPFVMVAAGAPVYIAFYYFPEVRSMTDLSLSPDIASPEKARREFLLSSPGFLKSPEKQIAKHVISFELLLRELVKQIDKQSLHPQKTSIANYH